MILSNMQPQTRQLVSELAPQATQMKQTKQHTPLTYQVKQAQLKANYSGQLMPAMVVTLRAQLIGYQGQPVVAIKDEHLDPTETITLQYQCDTDDVVKMLRGGLNENNKGYQKALNDKLVDQQFTRQDDAKLLELTLARPGQNSGLLSATPRDDVRDTLMAVQADSKQPRFDKREDENTFGPTLQHALDTLVSQPVSAAKSDTRDVTKSVTKSDEKAADTSGELNLQGILEANERQHDGDTTSVPRVHKLADELEL